MKKISLLHVITGLEVGGAEKILLDMVVYSDQSKFDTHVVSLSQELDMLPDFKEAGVNIHALNQKKNLPGLWTMMRFLSHYISSHKIEIVHAHMTHALLVMALVKIRHPKVKVIFTSHTPNLESKVREFLVFLLKPSRKVDLVASEDLRGYYYKKDKRIVPNAIRFQDYKVTIPKHEQFTFVAVGRLEYEKNHKLLIECCNVLKNKHPFNLYIAGDGSMREELQSLIDSYALTDRIKLLGIRDDIPKVLGKAHCFLMSSFWESMSLVVLEAAAAGLPVISTPAGSLASILNKDNALLSDEDSYCQAMQEVMVNYDMAVARADVLHKELAEKCDIAAVMLQIENIYLEQLH